jgi:hypothetical protein
MSATSPATTTRAEQLLELTGEHTREILSFLSWAEEEIQRRLDRLPDGFIDPDVLLAYRDAVVQACTDLPTIRILATQTMYELAVEREVRSSLEKRVENLEQRIRSRRG